MSEQNNNVVEEECEPVTIQYQGPMGMDKWTVQDVYGELLKDKVSLDKVDELVEKVLKDYKAHLTVYFYKAMSALVQDQHGVNYLKEPYELEEGLESLGFGKIQFKVGRFGKYNDLPAIYLLYNNYPDQPAAGYTFSVYDEDDKISVLGRLIDEGLVFDKEFARVNDA